MALGSDAVFIIQHGAKGALLRIPATGGAAEVLAEGLSHPAGLKAVGSDLYWTETVVPGGTSLPFVPSSGAMIRVMARAQNGAARVLAEWPGYLPSAAASPSASTNQDVPPAEILATDETSLYVRLSRPMATEFIRVPRAGGAAKRIAAELGRQHGVHHKGRFYWTAPSLEATPNSGMVRVISEGRSDGPETVAEWLVQGGRLASNGDGLFYAGDYLFRIPNRLAFPRRLQRLTEPRAASDGKRLLLLGEGPEPKVASGARS